MGITATVLALAIQPSTTGSISHDIHTANTRISEFQQPLNKTGGSLTAFQPQSARDKKLLAMGDKGDVLETAFYGKVVDQNEQPVAGATVFYELGGGFISGSNGAGTRVTNANGEFEIVGREASIMSLNGIQHPDIEFRFPAPERVGTLHSPGVSRLAVYGFQPQAGAKEVLWSDTSKDKPYVFKAWRKIIKSATGEVLDQTAKNLKVGEYGYRYGYDKIFTLDLLKPIMEVAKEGEVEGQLRVIFHREADSQDVTQKWEAHIIPVDGGIQTANDPYMNLAPESGYESEIHIVRAIADNGGRSIDNLSNQQYYFYSNNGKIYGSLFVAFTANSRGGEMKMEINYKLNLDGERSLVKE